MPRITLPDFDYAAQKTNAPEAAKFRGDRDAGGRGRSSSPKPYTRFGANRGGQGSGATGGRSGQGYGRQGEARAARPAARPQTVGSGISSSERPAARGGADRFAQAAATNSRQALRGAEATRSSAPAFGARRKPFTGSR